MLKKTISIFTLAMILLSSCKKDLPEIGGTSAQKIANEWWVTFTVNGADIYGLGHQKLATYNTAANTNEIWIDDFGHTWDFKVKSPADFNALTFGVTKAQNEKYNITADIINGKVLVNAGHSRAGNITDSIYFQAKFSDDPTTTYTIAGTARTRFIEDEY